ncbi:hypothetical protein GWK47_024480 [Chionoecetes opilio]|uniref:Uncharacterized protein n=1 Tax=Chionoecetes opilio TaxID=41210 RepID=A0A8J4XLK5_CHIOP|nr:hypothetical protein GWK47_024480 [Chionoecetes opilio]
MELNVTGLDEGDGVEATLRTHSAQWHKKCRLKFNKKIFDQQSRAEQNQFQDSNLVPVLNRAHTISSCPQASTVNRAYLFFCNKPAGTADLHEAATKEIDKNFGDVPLNWGTLNLLAKLSAGDMIAIEAKYHRNCLRALYNKIRPAAQGRGNADRLHGIAFAKLVVFMRTCCRWGQCPCI